MSFFSRIFSKFPAQIAEKGDKHMASGSFYDARACYEEALGLTALSSPPDAALFELLTEKIAESNKRLAELNIAEAESALARGDLVKGNDHLDLAISLTDDLQLREMAERLRSESAKEPPPTVMAGASDGCDSCSCNSHKTETESASTVDLPPHGEYYRLLIQQLPQDQQSRYENLGESFAEAYVLASQDEHVKALELLKKCYIYIPEDIYLVESARLLYRLGRLDEAETHIRSAIDRNDSNSLARLSLAQMQLAVAQYPELLETAERMLTDDILPDQASLFRAEALEGSGRTEEAQEEYIKLLKTGVAVYASQKLHAILLASGDVDGADAVMKKYLRKSCC